MQDATKPANRNSRFTKASGMLDRQIAHVVNKRGFSQARLVTHWHDIVGTEIATQAQPVAVKYAHNKIGATLSLLVNGANAPQIQMQTPQIIERVNAFYGFNAIQTIKLTQTSSARLTLPAAPMKQNPTKLLPDQKTKQIANMVQPVTDKGLRKALTTLGQHIAQKQTKGTP